MKDRVGRVRYVVFAVEAARPPSRAELGGALAEAARACGAPPPALTLYDGARGILRTGHAHAAALRAALAGPLPAGRGEVRVRPLGTSGTLRAAKERWWTPR